MTIQFELDFFPSYAFSACADLRAFAVSVSAASFEDKHFSYYKKLRRQATDLKNYAFLHGFIDCDEYSKLSNSIFDSSDKFWS